MNCKIYTGGMVATNGYFFEGFGKGLLIDAPMGVADWLRGQGVESLETLILTHQHFDHVEGVAELVETFGCRVAAHSSYDESLIGGDFLRSIGMPVEVSPYAVDKILRGGDELEVGGGTLEIRAVPGHSVDSVAVYCAAGCWVASGDSLMAGSIGRTDLPGGNHSQLLTSIREQLLSLPGETGVLPGHGGISSVAEESEYNPFLQG